MLPSLSIFLWLVLCVASRVVRSQRLVVNGTTFPRWEHRVVDCLKTERCQSYLKDGPVECPEVRDQEGATRILCALECSSAARVDPLGKENARKFTDCIEDETYGKIQLEDDWYIWIKDPCIPLITADCLFARPSREQTY